MQEASCYTHTHTHTHTHSSAQILQCLGATSKFQAPGELHKQFPYREPTNIRHTLPNSVSTVIRRTGFVHHFVWSWTVKMEIYTSLPSLTNLPVFVFNYGCNKLFFICHLKSNIFAQFLFQKIYRRHEPVTLISTPIVTVNLCVPSFPAQFSWATFHFHYSSPHTCIKNELMFTVHGNVHRTKRPKRLLECTKINTAKIRPSLHTAVCIRYKQLCKCIWNKRTHQVSTWTTAKHTSTNTR